MIPTGQGTSASSSPASTSLPSVVRTTPAGLSDDLLTGVMLVYSELVSRSNAMSSFRFPASYDRQKS